MHSSYYDPIAPDSFGSAVGLQRQTKGHHSPVDIRRFLAQQDAYTLHADVKRRFPRRKTLALAMNDLWQADLVDLSSLASSNDGHRYLLIRIDVLSKKQA